MEVIQCDRCGKIGKEDFTIYAGVEPCPGEQIVEKALCQDCFKEVEAFLKE